MTASRAAPTPPMEILGSQLMGTQWHAPKTNSPELEQEPWSSEPNKGPIHARCALRALTYAS